MAPLRVPRPANAAATPGCGAEDHVEVLQLVDQPPSRWLMHPPTATMRFDSGVPRARGRSERGHLAVQPRVGGFAHAAGRTPRCRHPRCMPHLQRSHALEQPAMRSSRVCSSVPNAMQNVCKWCMHGLVFSESSGLDGHRRSEIARRRAYSAGSNVKRMAVVLAVDDDVGERRCRRDLGMPIGDRKPREMAMA